MNKFEEIQKKYNTNLSNGLTGLQIKKSFDDCGPNKIIGKKNKKFIVKFFSQFLDPMIILLLVATIISIVVSVIGISGEPHSPIEKIIEYVEPVVIGLIVILNALFGAFQEQKAENALNSLQKMTSPMCKVIREGIFQKISSHEVVVGDLLVLDTGDVVPADAIIISQSSLKCEESILTGESLPSEKNETFSSNDNTPLGDRKDELFSGTSIVNGRAKAIVTSVGMKTQIGHIAKLIDDAGSGLSPLQKKLGKLSKMLGIFAILVCITAFLVYIFYVNDISQISNTWGSGLKVSISLAVASIPEGLLAIVTVVLALGVKRMVKQNALIKKLPSVETLGSTSIICSDKTGTLTQNKMTIVKTFYKNKFIDEHDAKDLEELMKYSILCNDTKIDNNSWIGDPTETSMFDFAKKHSVNINNIIKTFPRVNELPFDSDRKMMTTIHKIKENKFLVVTKGAPDQVIKKCNMTNKKNVLLANEQMGSDALRVIAFGIKILNKLPKTLTFDNIEKDLEFVGLFGMIDPPREEVKLAITNCISAGIRPIMITGDHINTASAIARQLGILLDNQLAISGEELSKMSDDYFRENIEKYSVYARVSPENKIRIVKAWQAKGQVVAMTGDGVNDAPALQAADIGCAMGITGTDVSKSAADMILTDDNFATIVEAVKEGRGILDNIKRIVLALLATCISELFTLFCGMLIFKFNPFTALQILWVNLVTESFPGIALGIKKPEAAIMKFKPLPLNRNIINKKMVLKILAQGIVFSGLSLTAFYLGAGSFVNFDFNEIRRLLGHYYSLTGLERTLAYNMQIGGSSLAFIVLSVSQAINCFNLFSSKSIFKTNIKDLKPLMIGSGISLSLIAFAAFIPTVNEVFNTNVFIFTQANNSAYQYLLAIAFLFAITPTIIFELLKLINNSKYFKKIISKNKHIKKFYYSV
ncbi:MAG: cation-translocating P-type ATPase [Malacoplasma sp.]